MEKLIDGLLGRYESGGLSRRDLIGALAVLGATGASAWAAPAGFESSALNHVSIVVSDLQRSIEFYQRVFGLPLQSENKAAQLVQLKLGKSHLSIRRGDGPKGVDHFAIGIEHFNKDQVSADLKARGATPRETPGIGFHVLDPDGFPVQLIANEAG
ncbi:MAG TPA: VOC family protein [Micropepsaceae bacterium]|nr:VOC family protein [Micropepsaceae bacterium]